MSAADESLDSGTVYKLMRAAFILDDGPVKVAMLEEALRVAEMLGDDDLTQNARDSLVEAAIFGGRSDLALVTFSRCLAYSDAHPEEGDSHSLLWQYKWIAGTLDEFPQITRQQIDQTLHDLELRATKAGYSTYAMETLRWAMAIGMGDLEAARAAYAQFEQADRDGLGDCRACVEDMRVKYFAFADEPENALQAADPILKKRLRCKEIPHRTYGRVLMPLFRLGRLEEAAEFHRKGYRLIQRNPEFLSQIANHLQFLSLTANTAQALKIVSLNLPFAITAVPGRKFDFLVVASFALLFAAEQGTKTIKSLLPSSVPFFRENGQYPVRELQIELHKLAEDLASQLDRRNGNPSCRRRLDELPSLLAQVRPHSVVVLRKVKSRE
ncbi:MAG TPA: hypothetical protein VGM05_00245 [Planctomycetaceae bacterium]|jgi:tetratricopeptide (TPR) repeat protein